MKVAIKDIRLSPYQVREIEQDPDLESLAVSIEEHGQLVPIKVRLDPSIPLCPEDGIWILQEMDRLECSEFMDAVDEGRYGCESCTAMLDAIEEAESPYQCIFGHRRLAAMERGGFDEVEAIVADVDDQEAQIQALIENTQRKDLEAMELARALKALKDATGWTNERMESELGLARPTASEYLNLLAEPEDVQAAVMRSPGGSPDSTESYHITPRHVRVTRPVVTESQPRADILRKAAKEALTVEQTRKLAERYRDAETPEQKARVLEVPAKKQEALEIIQEDDAALYADAKKLAAANNGDRAMTVSDYIFRLQAAGDNMRRFIVGGRQIEIWEAEAWPIIRGLFSDVAEEITTFLKEADDAKRNDS